MNKHLQYIKYITKHKWYVLVECCKVGLFWRGLVHDMSKFLPHEWIPYANWFYTDLNDRPNYMDAWLLHIHRNKHHWQYWVLLNDNGIIQALPMPHIYRLEMWCDWIGAGKAITGKDNMLPWYTENKEILI